MPEFPLRFSSPLLFFVLLLPVLFVLLVLFSSAFFLFFFFVVSFFSFFVCTEHKPCALRFEDEQSGCYIPVVFYTDAVLVVAVAILNCRGPV